MSQDLLPGMGSIPGEKGVSFRTWAPNANQVFVIGSFNGWSHDSHPMNHEAAGYWAAYVEGAKPGDEYKYLINNGDLWLEKVDPYVRQVTNSTGNGIIISRDFDWEDDAYRMTPWNQAVIYEMHIGTYYSKDYDSPGDFYKAIEKLPYIQSLGINVIELMPVTEFPGGNSWGYNPSHPFAIESDYGGVEGLKKFVKEAHKLGLAVVMDVVYNHFGPDDLDLWQYDGWSENGMGGIYFYNDWRAKTPWGDTRPDYGRKEVRQYLRDNAIHWIEEYHIDGLRMDAIAYIRNVEGANLPEADLPEGWSLMQWINEEVHNRYPNALLIAEDLQSNEWLVKTTGEGGAGFSCQWDSNFVHPVRALLKEADDNNRDLDQLAEAIGFRYGADAFERVIYTESHDEVANGRARLAEEIQPGNVDDWFAKKRSLLGAAILFTAPGIPMIFQGQEFNEDKWFDDTDKLEWDRTGHFSGIIDYYRSLIALRRNLDNISMGLTSQQVHISKADHENKIMAYHRWEDQGGTRNSVMVVLNLADRSHQGYRIGFPYPGEWKLRFNSDSYRYNEEFGNFETFDITTEDVAYDGMPYSTVTNIGPYIALIYSQD